MLAMFVIYCDNDTNSRTQSECALYIPALTYDWALLCETEKVEMVTPVTVPPGLSTSVQRCKEKWMDIRMENWTRAVDFAFLSPLSERFFSFSTLQVQTIQFSPHLAPYSTPFFLPFSPSLFLAISPSAFSQFIIISLCSSPSHPSPKATGFPHITAKYAFIYQKV